MADDEAMKRAAYYRHMAAHARAKAETLKDFAARKTMLEVARLWDVWPRMGSARRTPTERKRHAEREENLRRSLELGRIPVSSPKHRTAGSRIIIHRTDPNGMHATM